MPSFKSLSAPLVAVAFLLGPAAVTQADNGVCCNIPNRWPFGRQLFFQPDQSSIDQCIGKGGAYEPCEPYCCIKPDGSLHWQNYDPTDNYQECAVETGGGVLYKCSDAPPHQTIPYSDPYCCYRDLSGDGLFDFGMSAPTVFECDSMHGGYFGNCPPVTPPGDKDGDMTMDPHIKKWDGNYIDYQGECDLVLLSSPQALDGLGLEVHVRTTIQYSYSYIESAAVKIGDDVFELASWGESFLNGVESPSLPGLMGGKYNISNQVSIAGDNAVDKKRHHFEIKLDEQHYIELSTYKHFVNVHFHVDFSNVATAGLLGDYKTGQMLGRDQVTVMGDANAFGQEWQVQELEAKLFQNPNREPQAPRQKCRLPEERTAQKLASRRRRLGAGIAQSKVEEACRHMQVHNQKACVEDVMVTGDLGMAGSGAY